MSMSDCWKYYDCYQWLYNREAEVRDEKESHSELKVQDSQHLKNRERKTVDVIGV